MVELDPDSALETGEEAAFLREGLSRQVLRKLRRGHWVVQDELDLHGMTRPEAREALAAFIREAVRRARRCVRIVHGKGLGSKNREPVLKGSVRVWLAQREEVLAFCQAPAPQGGGVRLADDVLAPVDADHVAGHPFRPSLRQHPDGLGDFLGGGEPVEGIAELGELHHLLVAGDLAQRRGVGHAGADGVGRRPVGGQFQGQLPNVGLQRSFRR